MKFKRITLALVLFIVFMVGMVSCMNNIPCPAYASTTHKVQDHKS